MNPNFLTFTKTLSYILFIITLNSCSVKQPEQKIERYSLLVKSTHQTKQINLMLSSLKSPFEQQKGLMHHTELSFNTGVIMEFGHEAERGIWMLNMLIPLDVIFLNKQGHIVHIAKRLPPCSNNLKCPIIRAQQTQYIIELPAGFIEQNNISKQNTILSLP